VDVSIIEGGTHDLALSRKPAREKYLATVLDWLDATALPTKHTFGMKP
jgi:alpha-beta hydrolase superfamily lysophospholipase